MGKLPFSEGDKEDDSFACKRCLKERSKVEKSRKREAAKELAELVKTKKQRKEKYPNLRKSVREGNTHKPYNTRGSAAAESAHSEQRRYDEFLKENGVEIKVEPDIDLFVQDNDNDF
ncbi:hypothetical protein SK128_025705, partial [Halocaridina rubra]